MKKFVKKLSIFLAVILVLVIAFNINHALKKTDVGETVTTKSREFTVTEIETYEDKMKIFTDGYSFPNYIFNDKEKNQLIRVNFTIENIGKYDLDVRPDDITVDYDDGITYDSDYLFLEISEGNYKLYENGIRLEKVTSEAENFIILIPVPDEVITNTEKSLEINMYDKRFIIR
jgi:hypothetical protein